MPRDNDQEISLEVSTQYRAELERGQRREQQRQAQQSFANTIQWLGELMPLQRRSSIDWHTGTSTIPQDPLSRFLSRSRPSSPITQGQTLEPFAPRLSKEEGGQRARELIKVEIPLILSQLELAIPVAAALLKRVGQLNYSDLSLKTLGDLICLIAFIESRIRYTKDSEYYLWQCGHLEGVLFSHTQDRLPRGTHGASQYRLSAERRQMKFKEHVVNNKLREINHD